MFYHSLAASLVLSLKRHFVFKQLVNLGEHGIGVFLGPVTLRDVLSVDVFVINHLPDGIALFLGLTFG